jgi:hypothetical protein
MALELEDPLDIRPEDKPPGLPGSGVLVDVVAVKMELVRRVGAHDDAPPTAAPPRIRMRLISGFGGGGSVSVWVLAVPFAVPVSVWAGVV